MFAISMLGFVLFAMIVMTVNAVYAILDEWTYSVLRNWGAIIFASLSTIILWVFYWCSVIKWLIL